MAGAVKTQAPDSADRSPWFARKIVELNTKSHAPKMLPQDHGKCRLVSR